MTRGWLVVRADGGLLNSKVKAGTMVTTTFRPNRLTAFAGSTAPIALGVVET